jgi:flagellar motility protein MotE (MotC chaperone)
MINKLKKALIVGGCAAALAFGTNTVVAQGRGGGNFDPAQFKQRMLDDTKEALEVKDDAEWSALEPKVSKVMDARGELMSSVMRGFGRGRNRQRGGGGGNGDDQNNTAQQRRPRGNPFGGEPSAAVTALQKAIDDKAPTAEIKEKLKVVQDEYKAKQAALVAAQEDLRAVLTPRQEAIATLHGLL